MKKIVLYLLFLNFGLASLAADRPNIILIMADDMGYECLGSYGSTAYATPILDSLAAQGIRFSQF